MGQSIVIPSYVLDPIVLGFGNGFTPDMPVYNNSGSAVAQNVVPRTPSSYGPIAGPAVYSGALTNRCQGAYACLDSSGNVNVFAGDSTNLYRLTSANANFAQVSKSAGVYTIAADSMWRFMLMNGRAVACNFNDPLQTFTVDSGSAFSDLANGTINSLALTGGSGYTNGTYALSVSSPGLGTAFAGTVTVAGGVLASTTITNNGTGYPQTATIAVPAGAGAGTGGAITPTIATTAPKGRYIAVVKNFLVLGNTTDATNGNQPQAVWWGALNDPTNWPTPGTATAAQFQSDYNNLYGDGGAVTGVVGNLGTADGAVFMEHAVWRMAYAGPPAVFNFLPAQGVRGTVAPASIVQLGSIAYYWGDDSRFYAFDGTSSVPIGANRVDKYVQTNLDATSNHRIVGSFDPLNNCIVWAFPFLDNSLGNPTRLIYYHPVLDRWSIAVETVETILRTLSIGYNLDTLDSTGYNLDTLPFSLDSRVWTGGNPLFSSFDTSHKMNYFNGANLAATIDTAEINPFPGKRARIHNARPLTDVSGTPSVAIGVRDLQTNSSSLGTAIAMNTYGSCPQNASGRYITAEITIPSGKTWTEVQGVEINATIQGAR